MRDILDIGRQVSPEMELLLWSGRTQRDRRAAERMCELVRGDLAWDRVLKLGYWHGMLPALYSDLGGIGQDQVPERVLEQLRDRYYGVARRNLHLTSQLISLLDEFRSRDIPVIPLKGAVFSNTLYENPCHREFADLDMLVRREDAAAAEAVLLSNGFTPWTSAAGTKDAERLGQYAHTFSRDSDGLDVDLHWGFAPRLHSIRIDADAVWDNTYEVPIQGETVRVLRPETSLLLLCVHGGKHGPFPWPQLKWVRDVEELLRAHPQLVWSSVKRQAREVGCFRFLLLGCQLAGTLRGAKLTEEMREDLRCEPVVESLADWVSERLCGDVSNVRTPLLQRVWFDLRLRQRARDKILYSFRRLAAPTKQDRSAVRLPSSLSFLYYPYRLARLAVRYGAKPWYIRRLLI